MRHDQGVSQRIHDEELDTSETVVCALLSAQCPQWVDAPLTYLDASGTDNAMWRVRTARGDVVVRLPRRDRQSTDMAYEIEVLRAVAASPLPAIGRTPQVLHAGAPTPEFPCTWAVLSWLDGVDAWTARQLLHAPLERLATDLAGVVRIVRELTGLPARRRADGDRGGAIGPLLDTLDRWLDDPRWNASAHLDVAAVRRCADQAREVAGEPVAIQFVHGDLIPGNLLVGRKRLTAVLDWTSAALADAAQDLTPAWAVLDARSRAVFRESLGADDAAWLRGRAFALEQAVGGVVYYRPRRHPLGDVMARTLRRILDDAR